MYFASLVSEKGIEHGNKVSRLRYFHFSSYKFACHSFSVFGSFSLLILWSAISPVSHRTDCIPQNADETNETNPDSFHQ